MVELIDVTGVSETRADNLRDEGFSTVDDIAEADASDLEEVHGVGEATAYDLIDSAQEVITEEHTSDDEEPDEDDEEEEEVGLEDLAEVNDGDPEGYNERTESEPPEEVEEDDEPEVEEDEPEEVEAEDDGPEVYSFEIEVPSDQHYDYFLKALIDARLERSSTNYEAQEAIGSFIESVRPLGGEGTVEAEFTSFGLNTIHASVQQAESRHQQNRQTDAFEALRDMKEQVDEARAEYIF